MKNLLFTMLVLFACILSYSQNGNTKYYMPLEIKTAYENGTRSYDGKPGANYWQNTVDYDIKLSLLADEHRIEGSETVTYYNNSPKEINSLIIRLYYDVYKKGNPRNKQLEANDIHNGIELSHMQINGRNIDLNDKQVNRTATNLIINLKEPLPADSFLIFKTNWKQNIATESLYRCGTYNNTNFFIAYWYPQIAVYDDVFGWDRLNYNLSTEFYNNLANFDVKITAPENYVVIGTGTLKNANKTFPKEIFKRYQEAKKSEEIIEIISAKDLAKGFKSKEQTWHYIANKVSDFALCATNSYQWQASTLNLKNKQVFISSIYPRNEKFNYAKHINTQKKSIRHFSEDNPGVMYPYEAFTTFISGDRNGGMEFPMMANNGTDRQMVTIHEIFHTYMPMYVRTNERLWAFMDEGWAVYNTLMIENKYFKYKTKATDFINDKRYMWPMGKLADVPLITPSEYTEDNYGYLSYAASATINTILNHYLGDSLFLECYQGFIKRWAQKSPTPYDLFFTFEDISGKDLSWLLKPWYFEFGYADIDIERFKNGELTIVNKGNKPVPVFIELIYKNDSVSELEYTAGIWENGNSSFKININDWENIKAIHANKTIADINRVKNSYPEFKSITDLVIRNIEKYGVDSALNLYKIWMLKNPNIYLNHNYKNSDGLKKVVKLLKESNKIEELNRIQTFINQEFTLCKVNIKVLPHAMPKSGKIYITGAGYKFGNWKTGLIELNKNTDGSWSTSFECEKHSKLSFRFNGGDWNSDFLNKQGFPHYTINHTVRSDINLVYEVYHWKGNK